MDTNSSCAEFLKECEDIRNGALAELSKNYMKVKIKSLTSGGDNFFHKFSIALWQSRIEELIRTKYNGVDPAGDYLKAIHDADVLRFGDYTKEL